MNYIYLIQSLENSYYKVGVSKHPQKRINELSTGNPSKLKLIEVYKSEYAYQIEKSLQNSYSHLRKEREWFDMSVSHELSFIGECIEIEKNIIFMKSNGNIFI